MSLPTKSKMAMLLIWSLAGCGDTPGDISSVQAYVVGRVVTPGNDPVSGASVHIVASESGSGNQFADAVVQTTGDGIFTTVLRAVLVAPQETEIGITVSPPSGSPLTARTIAGLSVRFSAEDPPTDSLRVDITLSTP